MPEPVRPFFSVIICTYNRRRLLERALNSLRTQTFRDFELIILDDGGDDRSDEVAATFAGAIYHRLPHNVGVGAARNAAVALATGQYITSLDSDDEYLPNHLAVRHAAILANPDVDFFYHGYEILGDPWVPDRFDPSKLIHMKDCVHGPTFVFRREVFDRIGGYRPLRAADDPDFFERAQMAGFRFLELTPKTYIYHRDHDLPSVTSEAARLAGAPIREESTA